MIDNMRELTQGEGKQLETERLHEHETGVPELPESPSDYNLVNAITGPTQRAEPSRRLDIKFLTGTVLSRRVGRA